MMGLLEWTALGAVGITAVLVIALWELIWKGIAMWKCGRNNQLAWYIVILVFNTLGILPIIYLLFFQRRPRKRRRR